MPTYDFRCSSCDETFEVQRSMGSRAPVVCPQCGEDAKRVFSPVGVSFKGSGFHNTDYKPRPAEEGSSPTKPCADASSGSAACSTCPAAPK
jgi:putative FmdB family regulatory protein